MYATSGLNDATTKAVLIKNQSKLESKALTEAQLVEVLTLKGLTTEKAQLTATEILNTVAKKSNTTASLSQIAANIPLLASIKAVTAGLAAQAVAWAAANPIGVITLLIGAVMGANSVINAKNRSTAEDNRLITENAKKTKEQSDSVSELISNYKELKSAEKQDDSTRSKIKDIQDQITKMVGEQADNLDLVNGKLDEQLAKLQEINTAKAKEARDAAEDAKDISAEEADKGIQSKDVPSLFPTISFGKTPVEKALKDSGLSEKYPTFGAMSPAFHLIGKPIKEQIDILEEWANSFDTLGEDGEDAYKKVSAALIELNTLSDKAAEDHAIFIAKSIESSMEYYTLSESQTDFLTKLLRDTKLDGDAITEFVDSFGQNNDLKEAIDNLFSIDVSSETAEAYVDKINDLMDDILSMLDIDSDDEKNKIRLKFGFYTEDINKVKNELSDLLGSIDSDDNSNVLENLFSNLKFSELKEAREIIAGIEDDSERLSTASSISEFFAPDNANLIQKVREIQDSAIEGKISVLQANDEIKQSFLDSFGESEEALSLFMQIFEMMPARSEDIIGDTLKDIMSLKDGFDKLRSAYYDLQSGEPLSFDTIIDLLDKYPKLIDDLQIGENGAMFFNPEDLKRAIDEETGTLQKRIEDRKVLINNSIKELEKQLKEEQDVIKQQNIQDSIEDYNNQLSQLGKFEQVDITAQLADYTQAFENALNRYKAATSEIEQTKWADKANSALSGLKKLYEEGELSLQDYTIAVREYEEATMSLDDQLDSIQSAYDTASRALSEYNENGLKFRSFDVNPIAQGCAA